MKILILDNNGLIKQIFIKVFSKDSDVEILSSGFNSSNLINVFLQKFPDIVIIDEITVKSEFGISLSNVLNVIFVPIVFIAENEMSPNFGFIKDRKDRVRLIINKFNFKLDLNLFKSDYLALIKSEIISLGQKKSDSFNVKRIKAPYFDLNKNQKKEDASVKSPEPSIVKSYKASKIINFIPKNGPDDLIKYKGLINKDKTNKVIFIGSSTGGTEALRVLLRDFKKNSPPVVIVQHMPGGFTSSFAKSLDKELEIDVKEAKEGDILRPGLAIVADGNYHLIVKYNGENYFVNLLDGPLVNRHKPSVNVLFRSAAMYAGKNAIGVILTGMGDDGSLGMLEMKKNGALNIAQDEESSVVFGMPMEAIKIGAVDRVLPLNKIAEYVLRGLNGR